MKRLILLVFAIASISKLVFAVEEELPQLDPWCAIVYNVDDYREVAWKGDVTVKLFGNYTCNDSLVIEEGIEFLNSLCETVHLGMSDSERGKLEIYFVDSINESLYDGIIDNLPENRNSSWRYNYNELKISHFNLALRMSLVPENGREFFLKKKLAFALYPNILRMDCLFQGGKQIYEEPKTVFYNASWIKESPFLFDFSEFDKEILRIVYASNYEEMLSKAEKKYDKAVPKWLVNNAQKIFFFPLILIWLLFAGLFILFYKKVSINIKNKLLRFNVISTLSFLLIGISAMFYFEYSHYVAAPNFSFFDPLDTLGGMLLFVVFGLIAANIIRLVENVIYRNTQQKYFKVLLLFLSTSLIPSVAISATLYFVEKDNTNGPSYDTMLIFLMIFTIIGVIRALVSFFIMKEKEVKIETEIKFANLRELKTKAELNALHSKINPHFLYNSLNSIAGLANTNASKTEQMALSLSKLFRYSINKEQSDWSTIGEEMEMVKIYLDIEKVRFDDRLNYSIDLSDELNALKIPRFIIQPLVENAIKHGISKVVDQGEVTIQVRKEEEWLEVIIMDNGPDYPENLDPGFGLQSIYDKLEIFYPDHFEMHFLNSPNKQILIKLS